MTFRNYCPPGVCPTCDNARKENRSVPPHFEPSPSAAPPDGPFAPQDLVDRMFPRRIFGSGDTRITYDPTNPEYPYQIDVFGHADVVVPAEQVSYTIDWNHPSTKRSE